MQLQKRRTRVDNITQKKENWKVWAVRSLILNSILAAGAKKERFPSDNIFRANVFRDFFHINPSRHSKNSASALKLLHHDVVRPGNEIAHFRNASRRRDGRVIYFTSITLCPTSHTRFVGCVCVDFHDVSRLSTDCRQRRHQTDYYVRVMRS